MKIKDTVKGMFEVSAQNKVVTEIISGLWSNEDYARYSEAVEKGLLRDIKKMDKWAKLCDMRDYKMSSVVDKVNEHLQWCVANGLQETVCVVSGIIVQMQMKRTAKDKETNKEFVKTTYVETMEEAMAYLKSKGYC